MQSTDNGRLLTPPPRPAAMPRPGAQPSGCRSVKNQAGAEVFRCPSLLPCFCSLKAALLCSQRQSALLGGGVRLRQFAAPSVNTASSWPVQQDERISKRGKLNPSAGYAVIYHILHHQLRGHLQPQPGSYYLPEPHRRVPSGHHRNDSARPGTHTQRPSRDRGCRAVDNPDRLIPAPRCPSIRSER